MPAQRYNSEGRDLSRVFGDHPSSGGAPYIPENAIPSSEVPVDYTSRPMSYGNYSRSHPRSSNINNGRSSFPRSSFYEYTEQYPSPRRNSRQQASIHRNYGQAMLEEDFYQFHHSNDTPNDEHAEMVAEIYEHIISRGIALEGFELPRMRSKAVQDAVVFMYTEVSPLPLGFRLGNTAKDSSITVLLTSMNVPVDEFLAFQIDETMQLDYVDLSIVTVLVECMYWMLQTVKAAIDVGINKPRPSFKADQSQSPAYNLEEFLRYCEIDAYAAMVLDAEDDDEDDDVDEENEDFSTDYVGGGESVRDNEMDDEEVTREPINGESTNGRKRRASANNHKDESTPEFPNFTGDPLNEMIGKIAPTVIALCKRFLEQQSIEGEEIDETLEAMRTKQTEIAQLSAKYEARVREFQGLLAIIQDLKQQGATLYVEFSKLDAELTSELGVEFQKLRSAHSSVSQHVESLETVVEPECNSAGVSVPEVLKMLNDLPDLISKKSSISAQLYQLRDDLENKHMAKARSTHEQLRLALKSYDRSLNLRDIPSALQEKIQFDLESLRIVTKLNVHFKDVLDLRPSLSNDIDENELSCRLEKLDEDIRGQITKWNNELSDLRTDKTALENQEAESRKFNEDAIEQIATLDAERQAILEKEVELESELKDKAEDIKRYKKLIIKQERDRVELIEQRQSHSAILEKKEEYIKSMAPLLKPMVRDYQVMRKLYDNLSARIVKHNRKINEVATPQTVTHYEKIAQQYSIEYEVDKMELPDFDNEEEINRWVERKADVYFNTSS